MSAAVTERVGAELLQSGGSVACPASARAGFMPVSLEHLVLEGLDKISVYLRTLAKADGQFTLFSTPAVRFTEQHRNKLLGNGVKFVYIALADQARFRRQVEVHLEEVVEDPGVALSAKSELIYETSVELINELLSEQELGKKLPRLESVSRAVTTLVMKDTSAFSHLFAASQHDFYTATHMVNVGTWMVALAYALGITDMQELNQICLAGMVHDIGKLYVSEEVLNKKGKLSESDWKQLLSHPEMGERHLRKLEIMPEIVLRVTSEHHERMDGSGYPRGLKGDKMHLASRICAVVDSFDAMTAFRPFKEKTKTFGEALDILRSETPLKYDAPVVEAWLNLMKGAEKDGVLGAPLDIQPDSKHARLHERFPIDCPGRLHAMTFIDGLWEEGPGKNVTAHNISRTGLGFLSKSALQTSDYLRLYLYGTGTLANRVLEGQVVHCRDYSDGFHAVGLRFASLDAERRAAEKATRVKPT